MKLLLDTHCWLWMNTEPERFSLRVSTILKNSRTELFLSAASCWELSIKWAIGKLPLPESPEQFVPKRLERHGIIGLPIEISHTLHAGSLPMLHRDPFDRLLIAQAQLEGLTLLTADSKIASYPDLEILGVRS